MANKLRYENYSDTIRQMPQNYLIASKKCNRWLCEPDLEVDVNLAVIVFKSLLIYENKYETDGNNLLKKLRKVINSNVKPIVGKTYSLDWDGETYAKVVEISKDGIILFSEDRQDDEAFMNINVEQFKDMLNYEITI
jgi:hypothetical protein